MTQFLQLSHTTSHMTRIREDLTIVQTGAAVHLVSQENRRESQHLLLKDDTFQDYELNVNDLMCTCDMSITLYNFNILGMGLVSVI